MTQTPQKSCFVLMPFAERMKEIYTDVYVAVCEQNDLRCWRVDEISRPGSITRDIVEGILDSDVVIADLTSRNANVFYELGIAHSCGNKTIMTAQSRDDVPFDIASYRVIFYEHTLTGSKELMGALGVAIKELLAALHITNNPFQEVLAMRGGFRTKGKTPLFKAISVGQLGPPLKALLKERDIVYLEDLHNIDLQELVARKGFGKELLSQLCRILMEHDLYDNIEGLQRFILENHIRT